MKYKPQISLIVTANQFQILQDTSEHSSDQKSFSDPSVVSENRTFIEHGQVHSDNRGTRVPYKDNTRVHIQERS